MRHWPTTRPGSLPGQLRSPLCLRGEAAANKWRRSAQGNGVSGMRERVRALGGRLQVDSPARKGTTLKVMVPLPTQGAATEDLPMLQAITTGKLA